MQRVVSDGDVIIQLAKLNELNLIKELYELKLLDKLKAREFRIHPNIIESAIDSLEG